MCGIVGYIGTSQAAPILLDGLSKLEYRGYDSAGIAVYDGEHIKIQKAVGRLKVLSELTHDGAMLPGTVGIGHTRWATHGVPSDVNAHPHLNKTGSIVGIKVVDGSEDLLLVTQAGILIRTHVDSIRMAGRSTQGVIVMRFKEEGDKVISLALAEREETAEAEEVQPEETEE